jgi:hypothetical protein
MSAIKTLLRQLVISWWYITGKVVEVQRVIKDKDIWRNLSVNTKTVSFTRDNEKLYIYSGVPANINQIPLPYPVRLIEGFRIKTVDETLHDAVLVADNICGIFIICLNEKAVFNLTDNTVTPNISKQITDKEDISNFVNDKFKLYKFPYYRFSKPIVNISKGAISIRIHFIDGTSTTVSYAAS